MSRVRRELAGLAVPPPSEHGGDGAAVAAALGLDPASVLDLSISMNPFAPDVTAIVRRHAEAVHRYPDAAEATACLAEVIGVDPARVLLTNGGAEAIALVAREVRTASVARAEFSLWRRYLEEVDPSAPRVASNPNNPSGALARRADRAGVWDEAFYPISCGSWTRGDFEDGAIVVGSLTKLFSCPGLRLGYVIAPDEAVIDRLGRAQPAWSVGSLALAALPELLSRCDLGGWARQTAALRHEVARLLAASGLAVRVGEAPWVLVPDAPALRPALARAGVVVRDCTSFGLPGTQRFGLPREDQLSRLAGAIVHAVEAVS